jgi:hypothetical protein
MHASTSSLADLAALMGLDPIAAVALPTTITVVAAKLGGWTEEGVVRECLRNSPLRAYLAGVCRSIDVASVLA